MIPQAKIVREVEILFSIFTKETAKQKLHIFQTSITVVRFQVLTAASMKMAVFWVLVPCSLVELYRRFRGAFCLHHHRPDNGGSKHV
jgi:hypothetical protein